MKLLIAIVILSFTFLNPLNISAQEKTTAKMSTVIVGSVIVSVAGNAVYASFGGPGIKLSSGKWSVGLHMIPSLRFLKDKPRPLVTPALGGGVLAGYKRLIISLPFYYVSTEAKWKTGIGVGIKLVNSKSD